MKTHQNILVVFYILVLNSVTSDLCVNAPIMEGQRMSSSVFRILKRVSVFQCVSECLSVQKCKSINYSNSSKTCHLNSEDGTSLPTDLRLDEGFFYSYIDDWPTTLGGGCGALSCSVGERCIVDRLNKAYCVTDLNLGCDPAPPLPHALMTSSGVYPGAVTLYECEDDYLFCGTSSSSVCSDTGVWQGLNGTCGKARWTGVSVRFSDEFPCEMTEQYNVTIWGVPLATTRITASFKGGPESISLFQLSIRLNWNGWVNTLNFGSNFNNIWVNEQSTIFPISIGVEFKAEIVRQNDRYQVYIDGIHCGGVDDQAPYLHPSSIIIKDDVDLREVLFSKI